MREEEGLGMVTKVAPVCKLWHEIAQPVLMAHVVLYNDTLTKFMDNHADMPSRLRTIRSLTLHIQVLPSTTAQRERNLQESYRLHGYTQTQTLERNLKRFISSTLPQLTSLTCVSVFVDPTLHRGSLAEIAGFRLRPEILGCLLRALPRSCTSLELDTDGHDWSPDSVPYHLCSDIGFVLSRLRHVTLRVHNLCSRILSPASVGADDLRKEPSLQELQPSDTRNLILATNLSTLSICVDPRQDIIAFISCPNLQVSLDNGTKQPSRVMGWDSVKPLPLSSNLALAYKLGRFPSATKLDVIQQSAQGIEVSVDEDPEAYYDFPDEDIQRSELYELSPLTRDCIEDKTYPMPLQMIANDMWGLYDRYDTCVIGLRHHLERRAENTVWDETVYGARLPFRTNTALAGAIPKPPPEFLTRKEWEKRSKIKMVSWRKEEKRVGVKIRRVIPLDGVDVDFHYSLMPPLPLQWYPIPGDDPTRYPSHTFKLL